MPDDLILNTGQMRDAIHLTAFRVQSPAVNWDDVIFRGVQAEIDSQKSKENATAGSRRNYLPQTRSSTRQQVV